MPEQADLAAAVGPIMTSTVGVAVAIPVEAAANIAMAAAAAAPTTSVPIKIQAPGSILGMATLSSHLYKLRIKG